MKTTTSTTNQLLREAFVNGHESSLTGKENPHILTSNLSDAFELGRFASNAGIGIDCELHKSRGYYWIMDGQIYHVDGRRIFKA